MPAASAFRRAPQYFQLLRCLNHLIDAECRSLQFLRIHLQCGSGAARPPAGLPCRHRKPCESCGTMRCSNMKLKSRKSMVLDSKHNRHHGAGGRVDSARQFGSSTSLRNCALTARRCFVTDILRCRPEVEGTSRLNSANNRRQPFTGLGNNLLQTGNGLDLIFHFFGNFRFDRFRSCARIAAC